MGVFFLSWALWEQMTFVLAMCIVVVFCVGLVKLWWVTRLSKRQEILDQEKRARLQEMRKAGLAVKKNNDIPFGIRAIQSGIEVDGIWISRTPTPSLNYASRTRVASSTTLRSPSSETGSLRTKVKATADDSIMSASTMGHGQTPPMLIASERSTVDRNFGAEMSEMSPPLSPSITQYQRGKPYLPHRPRVGSLLNEDTLRKLEGHVAARPAPDMYIPTSAPYGVSPQPSTREIRRPVQRESESSSASISSGSSHQSQPRLLPYVGGGNSTGTPTDPKPYSARRVSGGQGRYSPVPQGSPDKERDVRNPFDTPHRTPTLEVAGFQSIIRSETQAPVVREHLVMPEPTFGPGDIHANKVVRKVNSGFEVLPAGTFGAPSLVQENGSDFDLENGAAVADNPVAEKRTSLKSASNKLRKKSQQ